ncbi:hypothetical protein X777_11406 [Ooceraea biroi]|uniref:DUF4817 domain-containing protein n=1 Tax=Ooceraea biroi TaxID=2015173 RepID=A0A026W1L6_OOCBI|nr:hypothetical protein X777_11406 [Ooceraea biroi]
MPKVFSNEEYTDIHFVYGFCDGNARAAVREYQRRFPNRRVPDSSVFSNTHFLHYVPLLLISYFLSILVYNFVIKHF